MNNDEVKDVVNRLVDAADNLDKTVVELSKTVNRMLSFCGLMLLVLFGVTILAIVF